MKKFFNILGIITLIGSVLIFTFTGLREGPLGAIGGLVGGTISGIFCSAVFFGIAAILGGQEEIMYKLDVLNPKRALTT